MMTYVNARGGIIHYITSIIHLRSGPRELPPLRHSISFFNTNASCKSAEAKPLDEPTPPKPTTPRPRRPWMTPRGYDRFSTPHASHESRLISLLSYNGTALGGRTDFRLPQPK